MGMKTRINLTFVLLVIFACERTFAIPSQWDGNLSISARAGGKQDCNCTSLFQCDLSADESSEVSKVVPGGGGGGTQEESDEEDGADLEVIDIRNGMSSSPSDFACKHYLEICCNHFQRTSQPKKPQPQPPRSQPSITTSVTRSGFQQCGRRNTHGVGFRIVGGIEGEAQMGEFTWMIAVTELSKDKQGTVYLCGGSLIHPRVVLTAAHCIENKLAENLRIRAGEWDTQTEREEPYVHYDRQVDKVIINEGYRKKGVLKNDIALILLSKDVPLARHIGTICLQPDLKPLPGQRCFASGWGKNLYGKQGSYQSILKKVDLPVIPSDQCQSVLRETRLGPQFKLHESFVCAGGERGRDTCKGDGGSPLVCQIPGSDHYAQYGIVSWGLNCGDPIPGAYVNVPYFVPWIESKLRDLGLDSSYFKS